MFCSQVAEQQLTGVQYTSLKIKVAYYFSSDECTCPTPFISVYTIFILPQTSNDGNVTVSELVFVPGPEDNEKSITCSIEYPESEGATVRLKDSHVLDVKRKYTRGHIC